jgi:hypothetical protein
VPRRGQFTPPRPLESPESLDCDGRGFDGLPKSTLDVFEQAESGFLRIVGPLHRPLGPTRFLRDFAPSSAGRPEPYDPTGIDAYFGVSELFTLRFGVAELCNRRDVLLRSQWQLDTKKGDLPMIGKPSSSHVMFHFPVNKRLMGARSSDRRYAEIV